MQSSSALLRSFVITVALTGLPAFHANAQTTRVPGTWVGTGFVVSQPSMQDGKTVTCGLTYKAFIQDQIYRQGAPSIIDGSFGLARVRDTIAGFLKIVVEDLSIENGEVRQTRAKPYAAYLATKDGQTTVASRRQSSASDQPGGLFTIFQADDAFLNVIAMVSAKGAATVWFSRRQGGLDVPVELDLTVTATKDGQSVHSRKEITAFADCWPRLQQ